MSTGGNSNSTRPINSGPGIHTYEAPFYIYAMNWSVRNDKSFRLALSSVDQIQIVQLDPSGEIRPDPDLSVLYPYIPAYTLAFIPDKECQHSDLFATGDQMLRLYQISDDQSGRGVDLKSQLNNDIRDGGAALTSFDWNAEAMQRIVTSCTNKTCTVWDADREAVERYLAKHEGAVSDVSWGGPNVFATASYDGTIRISDVRAGGRSTQIHFTTSGSFGRVEWSNADRNLLALTIMESNVAVVLDMRRQWMPVENLRQAAPVTEIAWAPNTSRYMCTTGDDMIASIWELAAGRVHEYAAADDIHRMKWSSLHADWIAITYENTLQIFRIPSQF